MSILSNKRFFWLEHETIRAGSPTGTKLYDKTAELSRPPPLQLLCPLLHFSGLVNISRVSH